MVKDNVKLFGLGLKQVITNPCWSSVSEDLGIKTKGELPYIYIYIYIHVLVYLYSCIYILIPLRSIAYKGSYSVTKGSPKAAPPRFPHIFNLPIFSHISIL